MSVRELHVGQLVGRLVLDSEGRKVGRIHELHAEHHDGRLEVKSFLVGSTGLVARLHVPLVRNSALRAVTWLHEKLRGPIKGGYRVGWKQMDLDDPAHPRTTVPRERLREWS